MKQPIHSAALPADARLRLILSELLTLLEEARLMRAEIDRLHLKSKKTIDRQASL